MRAALAAAALALAAPLGGCSTTVDAGGGVDAGASDDPLAIEDSPPPGSLDDIHRLIIAPRCSGQPGLCHNGQFEPNLSTPSLSYAWLVNRPSLEKPRALRVAPGDPDGSVLIDKLRDRDVSTLMPLGAQPLTEDEIQLIERWIEDGALRRPGADPAPVLNNPPRPPEIAVFDGAGARLDGAGPFSVSVGDTIVLRHSVHDFETPDAAIPFAAFILSAGDGINAVLRPGVAQDPHLGVTSYDPSGPMGAGDVLNYGFEFTIPATIGLRDDRDGQITEVATAGLSLTPLALYIDEFPGGILGFAISENYMVVE